VSNRSATGSNRDQEQRFDAIFQQHHAEVYRYCVRRLGRSDGEDAAADVFAVAWRRLDDVPRDDRTRVWLLGVAYRIVGNQYRSRARRGKLSVRLHGMRSEVPEAKEDGLFGDTELRALVVALDSLNHADRELLRMVAWDGLSRREIAEILGIKENAVDQRVFRARSRLKARFDRSRRDPSPIESKEASA
jgi:RNA polymerase sigma-70 factor, ECF subfamily